MKRTILFLFVVAFPLIAFLQTASVSGVATGAEGQRIRILSPEDFISGKMLVLASSEIDEQGKFFLKCELAETRRAFIDINYQRAEIFLEPGMEYQLELSYTLEEQLKLYFDREPIPYEILLADDDELNQQLWTFNIMYNRFIKDNFNRIYIVRDKELVRNFKKRVDSIFQGSTNEYLSSYIRYKFADIEQFARIKSKDSIAKEYFVKNPVLYQQVEYTYLFNEFFQQFLLTSPRLITISDLIIAVNDYADVSLLDQALIKTGYLDDKQLRELVLIHSLVEIHASANFRKPQVIKMFKDVEANSNFPFHKKIVQNILSTFNKLATGTPAPNITMMSIGGFEFELKNLRSKPVLLMFFNSGQKITETYFDELAEIQNKFSAGLELISISMDNDPTAYLPLANSGKYSWTFAHYGNNPDVYDRYDIRDLPLFVLIDVEGNIARYPAPHPGAKLDGEILRVIH